MTLLHEAVDFKKLDVRVVERNVERGVLSSQSVDKSVSDLPDDLDNAQWVNIETLAADESGANSSN